MKFLTTLFGKKSSKKIDQVASQTEFDSETLSDFSLNSDSNVMRKKHLVLDLDETLFHSQTYKEKTHKFPVKFDYRGKEMQYFIAPRPGLTEFLEEMQKYYILDVYTCSDLAYAEAILSKIGVKDYFKRIFSRVDCRRNEDKSLSKDLSVIGVDASEIVFIDDLERHIKENSSNGFQIVGYYGEKKDSELKKLAAFLKKLAFCFDVRSVTERFQLFQAGKSLITENDLLLRETSVKKAGDASPTTTDDSESEEEAVSNETSTIEDHPHSVLNHKYVFLQKEVSCA